VDTTKAPPLFFRHTFRGCHPKQSDCEACMNGSVFQTSLKSVVVVLLALCSISTARAVEFRTESPPAAAGAFSINLVTPVEGSLSDNDLAIAAIVTSTFQLNSVKAQVDGRE